MANMIQKYGEDEVHLATRTNLMYIPWNTLFDLANITDPRDVTGRRDFHVVGEGFGLTSVEIIAIREKKRESSVTMAIFEAVSKNGKTYMDLLAIWLQHRIDGIIRIVESWPETLQRKRRSELRNCNPRASLLTPVQTSWDCPSTLQSNHRFTSRRNSIPDEHHSRLHWQPDNFNGDDNQSIDSQSTNISNENNMSACVSPHRPGTQYRPNIESSDSSNHVPSSPWQRMCEPDSPPSEGGNIPTFIQQNISLGDDDPRPSQREITDSTENLFEDHHSYIPGPSNRFIEDPTSRFASVTAGPEPTLDHQVHNLTSSSPHRLEHQIVDHQVHNSKRASSHRLEHQIIDQSLQDGAHCLQNVGNDRILSKDMTRGITPRNHYISEWLKNSPLTREEQWGKDMTRGITPRNHYISEWLKNSPLTREEQWGESWTWSPPSPVPSTEPEGNDNKIN